MKRCCLFISGSGSNAYYVVKQIDRLCLDVKIDLVISNKDCLGITKMNECGIETRILKFNKSNNYKKLSLDDKQKERDNYEELIYKELLNLEIKKTKPDFIYCLGWNHILGSNFIDKCSSNNINIYNLHPALHNDLIGLNCINKAYNEYLNGRRLITGCMIHELIADVDKGVMISSLSLNIQDCNSYTDYIMKMDIIEKRVVLNGLIKILNILSSNNY
jgi:phosphoribosylglycinamide formyltransferase